MIKAQCNVDIVWAFDKAVQEVALRDHQGKAVVVWAYNSIERYPDESKHPWNRLKRLMQQLFELDVTIVVSAGNDKTRWTRWYVDTLPALWEGPGFPLIVAGSVDNFGRAAAFSQGPQHVSIWAPGIDVHCAKRDTISGGRAHGTSVSAGMVKHLDQVR